MSTRGHLKNNAGVRGHSCGDLFARTGNVHAIRVAPVQPVTDWKARDIWPVLQHVVYAHDGSLVSIGGSF